MSALFVNLTPNMFLDTVDKYSVEEPESPESPPTGDSRRLAALAVGAVGLTTMFAPIALQGTIQGRFDPVSSSISTRRLLQAAEVPTSSMFDFLKVKTLFN